MNSKIFKTASTIILMLCFTFLSLNAQKKTTVDYVKYNDTTVLKMDIYQPDSNANGICVIFVHGGAFYVGMRDYKTYPPYFKFLTDNGYTAVSVDYRLGLKGQKAPTLLNREPLINAVDMSVEDIYAATNYLIKHANEFNIDTSKIVLHGESAGAITVLQCDFDKRNNLQIAKILPDKFEYAGIISCAGAIYSKTGVPNYKTQPAPTFFFHGQEDKFVPYGKVSMFGVGMFGSQVLAKKFKKEGFPYQFYSFENVNHEAAIFPIYDYRNEILDFIQKYVVQKHHLFIDADIKDEDLKANLNSSLKDYMNKK